MWAGLIDRHIEAVEFGNSFYRNDVFLAESIDQKVARNGEKERLGVIGNLYLGGIQNVA